MSQGRPAEVAQFSDALHCGSAYVGKHDVLWLDIAVRYFEVVHVVNSRANLSHALTHFFFGEPPAIILPLQVVEEGAALHVLHQEVNIGRVSKEPVQPNDVDVLEEHLNFDFPGKLLLQGVLLDYALRNFLEGV